MNTAAGTPPSRPGSSDGNDGLPDESESRADGGQRRREPIDVRLAAGAAAAWIAALFRLTGGAGGTLALAAGAAALGLVMLGARSAGRVTSSGSLGARLLAVIAAPAALALFCVALVLIPLAGRVAHARASPLARLASTRAPVTLELTVTADPRALAATGPAGTPRVAVQTTAERLSARGRTVGVDGRVLVLGAAGPWSGVLPGQRVRLDGVLAPELDGGALSVTLFARTSPQRMGEAPWWQRLAGRVRSALRTAAGVLPDQERGLLPGLIDGDTTDLDPVLAERFRLAGLTHLVAVSGTNCSIVIGVVLLLLRRARARPWLCAVLSGLVLVLFVVVARPSPSVLRAALMSAISLYAFASGRPSSAVPSLAAVTLALLLWDPTLAESASFAMSVLATAALLVLAPGWAEGLRQRRVPVVLAESVAVAAAAHLVTAPVVAALSGTISLVAVPANVLAEPVVALTTVLGFAAALLAPLWLGGGRALAWLAGWPCRWLVGDADFFGGLHGSALPWPGGAAGGITLLLTLLLVTAVAVRRGLRLVLTAAAITALLIAVPVRSVTSGWPPPGWVFVACDIGQGDGLVLNAGSGVGVEVDAGPDPVAMDRCLHDLGINHLALLVFSHFHLDHVGGVAGAVRGRSVDAVFAGPLGDPQSGVAIVQRVLGPRGLHPQTPPVGTHLVIGAVGLDVLGPARAFHGTRSDPNNSSLVLRATVSGIRILLCGDAEIDAQQALLDAGVDVRADVLKVAHHGSAYFDPDFLAAVHAKLAVVSVGLHNDYGHPSPLLLAAVARLGIPLLRTDHDGDVAVAVRNGRLAGVARGVRSSGVVQAAGASHRGGASGPPVTCADSVSGGAAGESVFGARMGGMPSRPISLDDLPTPLPPVVLVVGDEELLVDRAVGAVAAAARRDDAAVVQTELSGGAIEGSELHEMLGPSLFGDARVLIIRAAQDVRAAALTVLSPYLQTPADGSVIVLQHPGGAKGKVLLETARRAKALEIGCAKLTRPDERADFVRAEVRGAGGRIAAQAVSVLLDAVGSDLRELAAVAAQLVSDSGGDVDLELVQAFHRGRAEVSGFAVSDLAVVGRSGPALEALRFALSVGVPYVVIADALADGVRSVARVASAGRGDHYALAKRLGMPPWKVKRASSQGSGWTEAGLRSALGVVATLNADVKGEAADPAFALELAVRRIGAARATR